MIRVEWKGKFRKKLERREFSLNFNANTLDAANTIISDYVAGKNGKGWTMISNEVNVRQLSQSKEEDDVED